MCARMTGEARNQRSFVLVSCTDSIATEVKRVLGPYRRVRWARDADEARSWFEREGTPGRAAAMLRHRFSGRLPKA